MSTTIDRLHDTNEQDVPREQEKLPQDFTTYDQYRTLCDVETDAFRRVGILESDAYHEALQDPRTVFCMIDGKLAPALTPLVYEVRYNAERTEKMTGKQEVVLLSIPLSQVAQGVLHPDNLLGGTDLSDNFAILIEEMVNNPHDNREAEHAFIAEMLSSVFGKMEPHDFQDERLAHLENNKNAWMGIFSFSINSARQISEDILQLTLEEGWKKAWQEYCEEKGMTNDPGRNPEGTYLLTPDQLEAKPEILDELWGISEMGFGQVLGKHHPVAMEVTRGFFDDHIKTEGVFTVVRYHEGKPACFGFFAPNMEHNEWLDCESSILKQDLEAAKDKDMAVGHFFELISRGEKEVELSPSILSLCLDLAGRTRESWHIIFESTNLSATYIPRIADRQIRRSESVELIEPIKMLSELDYWYLASSNS